MKRGGKSRLALHRESPSFGITPAGVGGAAGGEATLYGGPLAGGAAAGLVTSSVRQGLNLATGKQEEFSLTSLAAETAGGAVLSYAGSKVLPAIMKLLPNNAKGAVGEWTSYVYNRLKGNTPVEGQVPVPLPSGRETIADWQFLDRGGLPFFIESKFGTAGLHGPQIEANRVLPNYVVERWTYGWVEAVGGEVGWALGITLFNQTPEQKRDASKLIDKLDKANERRYGPAGEQALRPPTGQGNYKSPLGTAPIFSSPEGGQRLILLVPGGDPPKSDEESKK